MSLQLQYKEQLKEVLYKDNYDAILVELDGDWNLVSSNLIHTPEEKVNMVEYIKRIDYAEPTEEDVKNIIHNLELKLNFKNEIIETCKGYTSGEIMGYLYDNFKEKYKSYLEDESIMLYIDYSFELLSFMANDKEIISEREQAMLDSYHYDLLAETYEEEE